MEIRVAIFEDNKLMRDALEAILNGTPGFACCGAFADASMLEQRTASCHPDVVLMDIEMPGINGIMATDILHQKFPNVRVLIQTVFEDNNKIFQALCAGASGYILKNDPPAKQIEAIREVYEGGAPISPVIARKMLDFFTHKNIILTEPGHDDFNLTDREKEILHFMVNGMDYRTIAEKNFISYETVRTHAKKIFRKLQVANRSEAILKANQKHLF